MTAPAIVLTAAAVFMFGFGPAYFLALAVREHLDRREADRRREQQGRKADAEWLAVLAATDTPIFAEVWAESLRHDLEEWSA